MKNVYENMSDMQLEQLLINDVESAELDGETLLAILEVIDGRRHAEGAQPCDAAAMWQRFERDCLGEVADAEGKTDAATKMVEVSPRRHGAARTDGRSHRWKSAALTAVAAVLLVALVSTIVFTVRPEAWQALSGVFGTGNGTLRGNDAPSPTPGSIEQNGATGDLLFDMPRDELVASLTDDELKELLVGRPRDEIVEAWGEPVSMFSGMWGEVWSCGVGVMAIVYYENGNWDHVLPRVTDVRKVTKTAQERMDTALDLVRTAVAFDGVTLQLHEVTLNDGGGEIVTKVYDYGAPVEFFVDDLSEFAPMFWTQPTTYNIETTAHWNDPNRYEATVEAVFNIDGVHVEATYHAQLWLGAETTPATYSDVYPHDEYIPLYMQPHTVIVYGEDVYTYIIADGGELTDEELAERGVMLAYAHYKDDEFLAQPHTKVEYDSHGDVQNVYFEWPYGSGDYQLSPPWARGKMSYAEYFSEVRKFGLYETYPSAELDMDSLVMDGSDLVMKDRSGNVRVLYTVKNKINQFECHDGYTLWLSDGTEVYRIFLPTGQVDFIFDIGYDSSQNAHGSFKCNLSHPAGESDTHYGDFRDYGTNGQFRVLSNFDIAFYPLLTEWYIPDGGTQEDALKYIVITWHHEIGIDGDACYYNAKTGELVGTERACKLFDVPKSKCSYDYDEYYRYIGFNAETMDPVVYPADGSYYTDFNAGKTSISVDHVTGEASWQVVHDPKKDS